MASIKERTTPAKERVSQLDERLADLRSRLGTLADRTSELPPVSQSNADGAPSTPDPDLRKVSRLALLVFNLLRSEPRLLRRFVHELARLEADHAKK